MLYLVWFLSLIVVYYLGYKQGDLVKKVRSIEETIKKKIDKPIEEEPTSDFIDPFDEVSEAKYQHEVMMKKLNPDE